MKRERTEADLRQMEKHYREQGFSDGYSGRPAKSTNPEYSRAWMRGEAAKRREEGDSAIGAASVTLSGAKPECRRYDAA